MAARVLLNCQAIRLSRPFEPKAFGPGHLGGVIDKKKMWRNGTTLNIRFQDGLESVHDKVKIAAFEWTQYANLKFNFDSTTFPSAATHILIGFDPDNGNASAIGTDSLFWIKKGKTSMDLGSCTDALWKADPTKFVGFVLHEFGHALGLQHEHQSTAADRVIIDMNKAVAYYQNMYPDEELTPDDVARNVGALSSNPNIYSSKEFDSQSIMIYPIPEEIQLQEPKQDIQEKYELSDGDKKFIGELYPK